MLLTKTRKAVLDLLSQKSPEWVTTRLISQHLNSKLGNTRRVLGDLQVGLLIEHSNDNWRITPPPPANDQSDAPCDPVDDHEPETKRLTAREGLTLVEDHKRLNREFITVANDMRKLSGALLKNMDNLRDFQRRMGDRHGV